MLDFISKDVLEHMERNGLEFSDFEKAALVFHSDMPVLKMLELLEQLAEETEDVSLREQILARLAYEREGMEAFRNNTEGYVYAVEACEDGDEPYVCGYFATADLAYAHGMKQGCPFKIEKYLIVGFKGREAKKPKGYFNPNLKDGADMEKCVTEHDYCGDPEAGADYGRDGTLESFWSSEIERTDEKELSMLFDLTRFENAFIAIPNPFERGDIVRLTTEHKEHGIVATPQPEWREFLERVESGRAKWADFVDASITVDFLLDDGHISHGHINPAFLERFEPQEDDMDYNILTAASAVQRGNGTLDFFVYSLNEFQKLLGKEK